MGFWWRVLSFFVLCLFCSSNGSKVMGFLFHPVCKWLQRVTQYLTTPINTYTWLIKTNKCSYIGQKVALNNNVYVTPQFPPLCTAVGGGGKLAVVLCPDYLDLRWRWGCNHTLDLWLADTTSWNILHIRRNVPKFVLFQFLESQSIWSPSDDTLSCILNIRRKVQKFVSFN